MNWLELAIGENVILINPLTDCRFGSVNSIWLGSNTKPKLNS